MPKTYSTPRRYDLATLMAVVAGYLVLFGAMRALYLNPFIRLWVGSAPFFWCAGLITLVGVGQALLFRRRPRLVSVGCGVVYCLATYMRGPVWKLVTTGSWGYYVSPEVTFIVLLFSLVLGIVTGYFSGVCVAGVFLVADYLRQWLGWESLEEDAAEVRAGGVVATVVGEDVVDDVRGDVHPLDRT